ncbi:MAG TPA: alanine racemase [Ktedonobacterales bacterium]|nr:alanine racemase [Ktedonobacterales bacterium]
MIPLESLIAATAAEVLVPGTRAACEGFAHDSRTIVPGECFVAVRGIRGDGHDYAQDALERGAGALLLERSRLPALTAIAPGLVEHARAIGAAVLIVSDTREALRRYAAYILRQWHPTVIAVTGSTGKTTTKEAIADVLGILAPTFRSWRNYNDLLGLPLSLGRLEPMHRFAIVELGADHPGEIADLCAVTRPQVGVVTNVSPAHLQYFGGVEALSAELSRLPAYLPADGLAILNGDDPATHSMAALTPGQPLFFGLENAADEHPRYVLEPLGSQEVPALSLRLADRPAEDPIVFPHLHGDHWIYAVLAALAVGEAFGVEHSAALAGLRTLCPLPGRMRWLYGEDGLVVLDDSHNATPASAAAGLHALHAIAAMREARAIAVLGDMLRLGDAEEHEHRQLGRVAASCAHYLVARGQRAQMIAEEAIQHGLSPERVAVTLTAEDAARAIEDFATTSSTSANTSAVVYIKGSEELRMEQVTMRLLAHPEEAEHVLDRQTQAWRRVVVMRPDRPTWLEIDLSAIGQNTRLAKDLVGPETQVLVSLKADAYGHGALRVARTVLHNGASWLGVATVSEAEPLRAAGITAPVLVFGYTAPWQAREAARLNLRATVYALESARALARAAHDLGHEVRIHVKVDTGMARLGLRAEDIPAIVNFFVELRNLPGLIVEGIFTHFATADSADQTYARRQLDRFLAVLAALDERGLRPPLVHAANSAAMLTLPEARFDMVRPGVAIYGLSPSAEVRLPEHFQPALAFKTQVAQVKDIPAGEGVSYGATYITTAPARIAVLPVGYADGFRRAPSNWGEVLVRGHRAPLVGRVCMDQCMVDVTTIPGVRQGDEVVLIGRQGGDELTAEAVAERLGTISYEVVAELLARVPRIS